MPTREIFWNISGNFLMYIFIGLALVIFFSGFYKHYMLWNMGQAEKRDRHLWLFIKKIISHRNILKETLPGGLHLLIFWGFIVLFLATVIIAIQQYFHLKILQGIFYNIYSLFTDLFGFLLLVGAVAGLARRTVSSVEKVDKQKEDIGLPLLIIMLVSTGFLVEGLRLAVEEIPWKYWSPVGLLFSLPFNNISISLQKALHQMFWWLHVILVCIFIALIPYTKLLHILAGSINSIFADNNSGKILKNLDFDDAADIFGAVEIRDFSWKQLLDLDACIRCGRCRNSCPAYLTGKPLNPQGVIQSLKGVMEKSGKEGKYERLLDYISSDAVWSCTTCLACQNNCPLEIEHVPRFVDMRRYMVLTEGEFPPELNITFRNLETNGNPWGIGWTSRADWAKDYSIQPVDYLAEDVILYWPGCFGSYDEQNINVSKAVVQVLQNGGIKFGILGNLEKCCGDSARRLGNEYLFQMLAMENIRTLQSLGIKTILTQCPHCYNSLKNEYPKLGASFNVVHHTQFIEELMKTGRIHGHFSEKLTITYHDPCYLGRYNKIYNPVREILNNLVNIHYIEMKKNKECSFCCGAGGGRMWLEERLGSRITKMRAAYIDATGAEIVCTACPYCMTMLKDELMESGRKVMDFAEILNKII